MVIAERKKANVLANNIRLTIASGRASHDSVDVKVLQDMAKSGRRDGDHYNAVRAIVRLARLPGSDRLMSDEDKSRLVEAYHFLYNERLFSLFDQCHDALWQVFEAENDRANLLKLFRRSSFIWRLNNREDKEAKYLAKLMKIVQGLMALGLTQTSRDGLYFIVRVTVVTGTAIADLSADSVASPSH